MAEKSNYNRKKDQRSIRVMDQREINGSSGFTLVELLVVLTIISLLITVVSISFSESKKRSRDARRVTDIKSLSQALNLYQNNHQFYPCSALGCAGGEVIITGSDNMTGSLKADNIIGANIVDPVNDTNYRYWYNSVDGSTYTLRFCQETSSIQGLSEDCDNQIVP